MARDYENVQDRGDLSDGELRDVVRAHFREHHGLDADLINVHVRNGTVRLEGRVGTDYERRAAEHVVTDVLGLQAENNLVVQAIHRAQSDEAIDEHLAEQERTDGLLLGDRPVPLSPEADHLAEDLDTRLHGTTDVSKAIRDAASWIPPESPTGEGIEGTTGRAPGEDH